MITAKEENTMKKLYEQPELEIITFYMEDVLTDSVRDEDELPDFPAG